jgi:hypothetical protein
MRVVSSDSDVEEDGQIDDKSLEKIVDMTWEYSIGGPSLRVWT